MGRRSRRGAEFGPRPLSRRLRELLPDFPDVALCVAFSGGADSTALLAALAPLKRAPLKLRAVHVDHGLHPDSAAWSRHCRSVARRLEVSLSVRRAQLTRARGESLEAAARAARYRVLAAALAPDEALLTAHHEEDQLETVLLQLLRGAGLAGLAAMPARAPFARGTLLRPLLGWPRSTLRAFLASQDLKWVEDPSNAHTRLDRNYLRAEVLPPLLARWPSAAATVARTAQHAAEGQQLLDALGAADAARAGSGAALSAAVLRTLPPQRRRNALRYWIAAAGLRAPPARRLEEIAGPLLGARADAAPFVSWGTVRVQREADLLSLHAAAAPGAGTPGAAAELPWSWRRARRLPLPEGGTLTLQTDPHGPIDLELLPALLTVRRRRGGERLRLLPGGPRRTLKNLLQEAHVPHEERARLPLLFAGATLLAAGARWVDAQVQARTTSRRRARLVWSTS